MSDTTARKILLVWNLRKDPWNSIKVFQGSLEAFLAAFCHRRAEGVNPKSKTEDKSRAAEKALHFWNRHTDTKKQQTGVNRTDLAVDSTMTGLKT